MTCVVGLVDKGKVWIGGDSAASSGTDIDIRKDPKVFRYGDFLIGFAGSWRVAQTLRHGMYLPSVAPEILEIDAFMVDRFAPQFAECVNEQDAEKNTTSLLVGVAGRLFKVDTDYQVAERLSGFDAIGDGAKYALGSLHSTVAHGAAGRVSLALSSAEAHCGAVRAPFIIESL